MENSNINTNSTEDNEMIKNNETIEQEEQKLLKEDDMINDKNEKEQDESNKENELDNTSNKNDNDENKNEEDNKNKEEQNCDNDNDENKKEGNNEQNNCKKEDNIDEEKKDEDSKKEDKKDEVKDEIKDEIKNDKEEDPPQNEMQYSHTLVETIKKYDIEKLPDNYNKEDANFKVLFLGDAGVGKTSLVIRGTKKEFDSNYKPTVGFDLINYVVKINDKVIKLQLWDTCGQEEFSMCNQSLFKNATIAVMVYSVINKKSYENVKKWVDHVKNTSKEDIIFFLVGNKNDKNKEREVSINDAKKYGKEFQYFVETSSKIGYNVDNLFKKIVVYLYENIVKNEPEENEESKIEEYISEASSSFFDSHIFGLEKEKKCLKCC